MGFLQSLPQVQSEPCGSSDAEHWRHLGWWWPSPCQICRRCAPLPSEREPKHTYRGVYYSPPMGLVYQCWSKHLWGRINCVCTSSSKTRFGAALSLVSKKTVPSRPNFGMSTMIAFFLTNRTNPSSFRMPRLLKNNWNEIICIKSLDSCSMIAQAKRFVELQSDMMPILTNSVKIITVQDSEVWFLRPKQVHRHQTSVSIWVYLCVEGHGRPLCILRHFMSVVEVVRQGRLLMFVHQIWVGAVCSYGHSKQAMYYNICVPV